MNETRFLVGKEATELVTGDGVAGYAAVYNVRSRPMPLPTRGEFVEVIAPGAFAKSLAREPDIRAMLEHDSSQLFARTKAGTMTVRDMPKGLYFEVPKLPDSPVGAQIRASMGRGELDACSIGFTVAPGGDTWRVETIDGKEMLLRTLTDITVRDVTLTSFPAYEGTELALRSLQQWKATQPPSLHRLILKILENLS